MTSAEAAGFVKVDGQYLTAEEWARRFKARVMERAQLTEDSGVADAECEAAMEDGSWVNDNPEDSADEALSYWDNDEAPAEGGSDG